MSQGNPFDQFDSTPNNVPRYGAPAKPDKPDAPKTTYRTLTPEEAATRGLDPAGAYQVSSEGKVDVVQAPATAAKGKGPTVEALKESTRAMLLGAGINLETGEDPILPLIAGSTSGKLQTLGAEAYGAVTGDATDGMEKIGRLKTVVNDMVLALSGGSLGAQISNTDRDFMAARLGDIGNPDLPASQRAASWDQVKKRFANILGVEMPGAPDDKSAPEGKKLVAYRREQDGSLVPIYADTGGTPPDGGTPPPADGGPDGGFSLFGATPDQMWEGAKQGVSSMVGGIGDLAGIAADPLNAGINAVAGTNLSTNLGQDLPAMMGLPKNQNALADAAVRFGTGAMTGSMAARGASMLPQLPGAVQGAVNMLGKNPVTDTVAGAAAGAGSQLGQQSGVPGGEIAGGLIGGLSGYGGANALARFATPKVATGAAQAAARQGVDMLPADAGGTATKIITSGAKASPLSAGPIRSAARNNIDQLDGAVRRVTGDVPTTDKAGAAVVKAAERYAKKTSAAGEQIYTRAYEAAGNVKTIKPRATVAAIDAQIARIQQNPTDEAKGLVKELTELRQRIEGGVSIQGLRDARTTLSSGVYDGKLRSNSAQGMYKKILGNVADDIDAGLRSAGKDKAASLFRRADAYWTGRVEHIDQVLQPIIGKEGAKGGEQVIESLESMARGKLGGNARLSRLLAEMTTKEAQGVQATIVNRLGRATAGAQDAAGETFSPTTFLTNWNKMTPQAKASLFSNKDTRRNLDDIALIAENMKATQQMSNFSNTAMAVGGGGQSAGAVAVGMVVHPIAAAAILSGQLLTGKLLASPGFARWLAKAPRTENPAALRKYTEQLGVLAGREAAIAGDARALQQHLQQSLGQSPSRAAAEEKPDTGQEPPQ